MGRRKERRKHFVEDFTGERGGEEKLFLTCLCWKAREVLFCEQTMDPSKGAGAEMGSKPIVTHISCDRR